MATLASTLKTYAQWATAAGSERWAEIVPYLAHQAPLAWPGQRLRVVRAVLERQQPDELAWLFGAPGQAFGFHVDMNTYPAKGTSALYWAITHRSVELVDHLLSLGAQSWGERPWASMIFKARKNDRPDPDMIQRIETHVPLAANEQLLLLEAIFDQRPVPGYAVESHQKLTHALEWADALMAVEVTSQRPRPEGTRHTFHHHILRLAPHTTEDDRQPWIDLLARHNQLNWEQADGFGIRPLDLAAQHPNPLATLRGETLKEVTTKALYRPRIRG